MYKQLLMHVQLNAEIQTHNERTARGYNCEFNIPKLLGIQWVNVTFGKVI